MSTQLIKVAKNWWLYVMFLLSLAGLVSYNAPTYAQSDGTIPQAQSLYLPIIANGDGNSTAVPTATSTTVAPTATPTPQDTNPRCLNPGAYYGFGESDRWTREPEGCGWVLAEGSPVTITVPSRHLLTTFFGQNYKFCQGVTVTITSGTLWQLGSNEPLCTSDATPTPTATNTPLPTATPTMTPSPTATNTAEPTATNTVEPTATNTAEPTATNTVEPTATNTAAPTATPTMTPSPTATAVAWKWQDSITVLSGSPTVVACGDEAMCFKWNMYQQGPATPIKATMHCTTQGSYIDTDNVEKYGLIAGVTYERLTGFTVRKCSN